MLAFGGRCLGKEPVAGFLSFVGPLTLADLFSLAAPLTLAGPLSLVDFLSMLEGLLSKAWGGCDGLGIVATGAVTLPASSNADTEQTPSYTAMRQLLS